MNLDNLAFKQSPHAQLLICPRRDSVLAANNQACRELRADLPTLLAARASRFFAEELPFWLVFTEEAIANGDAWSDALTLTCFDGENFRVEVSAKSQLFENDNFFWLTFQPLATVQWHRDKAEAQRHYESGISHWHRVAQVFREFERENQLILNAAGEGIYGVDPEGKTTFLNAAAERMLGWKKEELIGKNIHYVIHHTHKNGDHFGVEDCSIFHAIRDGIVRTIDDEVFWTKSGKAIDVEYTSTPIEDEGRHVGAVVIFRDVTQKRLDETRLKEALSEVERLKNRLEMENAYLQEEISSEFNHHQIVGKSLAVQQSVQKIEMVAPTDATTIIIGESGTGKELIARAIHDLSSRSHRSLIRVNCAAIPAELFESEFFGHSKGAFTGATDNRVGRFELADGGTLFLDEVGEIPLALQGKLLRVLQEQTFERVGESTTRNVDVRIIAATNKNLKALVEQGKFREDLFFRLNVFPIESVPLRKRLQDIPLLAQHFLNRAMPKANKPGLKIPLSQMTFLKNYSWPGNIRELENVIERQVILSKGGVLNFSDLPQDLISTADISNTPSENRFVGVTQVEVVTDREQKAREVKNIHAALQKTRGKVSGKDGAAQMLDLKPTTLSSRIKKYGIDVRTYRV